MSLKPNQTISSKYTKLNFLPLNLYRQVTKQNNIFFILTLILLMIPAVSPFAPYTYLSAVVIVIGISMIKDAIEDYSRHKQDRIANEKKILKSKRNNAYDSQKQDKGVSTEYILIEKDSMSKDLLNAEKDGFINEDPLKENTSGITGNATALDEEFEEICYQDLKAGDFIKVLENQEIPTDLLFLCGSSSNNCKPYCFVETSHLDGENNLKKIYTHLPHECSRFTNKAMVTKNIKYRKNTTFGIEKYATRENANLTCLNQIASKIENFRVHEGGEVLSDIYVSIEYNKKKFIEKRDSIILKGSILKGLDYIIGLVISTGENTKISKNVKKTSLKKSRCEKNLERNLFWIFLFYALMLIMTSFLTSLFLRKDLGYLYINKYKSLISLKLIGTNYILYSYMIPLSLFVMIEVSRAIQARCMSNTANCRNTNIIEDLGIVEYVLTDKTGTLTTNKMIFECFDIGKGIEPVGNICNNEDEEISKFSAGDREIDYHDTDTLFILALLTCNSLHIFNSEYEGSSQDEISIVSKLNELGYKMTERYENIISIMFKDREIKANVLNTLDFSSDRQRMSVIVEIEGRVFMFVKGSDQVLQEKISTGPSNITVYDYQSSILSNPVYRCLVVAYKEIDKDIIKNKLKREEYISPESLSSEEIILIENDLTFLGVTFVRDNLVVGVKETILSLKNAGIKVWMVTGDKRETAICVGQGCGLEDAIPISGIELVEYLELIYEKDRLMNLRGTEDPNAITNNTDRYGMIERRLSEFKFSDVDVETKSFIIYRTIPDHKAKITEFLSKKSPVLAIGDGNNDVSMINISTVGIGIKGTEGNQASLAADFVVDIFPRISKLILFYGRFGINRYAYLVLSSLQKNLFLIMFQFNYNFVNCFSGNPIFNSFFLDFYNILFTSFIPFMASLFERDTNEMFYTQNDNVSPEKTNGDDNITREENIEYRNFRSLNNTYTRKFREARKVLNTVNLTANLAYPLIKSTIMFWISYFILYNEEFSKNGIVGGHYVVNNYFSILVFLSVTISHLRSIRFVNFYILGALVITLGAFLGYTTVVESALGSEFLSVFEIYGFPIFYLVLIEVLFFGISMDLAFDFLCRRLNFAVW